MDNEELVRLLELVGNAEAWLLTPMWVSGPDRGQKQRGLDGLAKAAEHARNIGHADVAEQLDGVAPLFDGDHAHACNQLRQVRIGVRLLLNAATDAAGLPRVPPAQVVVAPQDPVRRQPKVGRNKPCPCGSGRKHKKCCGNN